VTHAALEEMMRMHPFTIGLILFWMFWLPMLPAKKTNAMDFQKYKYPEPHKFDPVGDTDA
jgi:hypothetical protein